MKKYLILSGLLFFGCYRPRDRCGKYIVQERWTLKVWVQNDPDIAVENVMEGCRFWQVVGVDCRLVRNRDNAHVQVVTNRGECEKGSQGLVIGRAYPGGKIVFYTRCMSHDDESLINISAHEIGHELGVDHTDQEYSSVMSPAVSRLHQCLLEADISAWRRRNRWRSVLESWPSQQSQIPWCNLPENE